MQESIVASQVFAVPIMLEFQGLIGVLFTSNQSLDESNIELPEIERILGNVPIEGHLIHQHCHHPIGKLVVKRIAALKMTIVSRMGIGANFSSHCGARDHFSTFQVRDDFSVD